MKKMICVLLALTTAISLCACGHSDDDYDRHEDRDHAEETILETEEPTIPAEPTEEETSKIRDYVSTVCHLKETAASLTQQSDAYSLEEIQRCYQTLMQIGSVKQWANTSAASIILYDYSDLEYTFDPACDWDLEAVLSRFTVVKDVKLSRSYVTCDNMGNLNNEITDCTWHYNAAGQELLVTEEDNILFSLPNCISYVDYSGGIREYDQAGRLSKITTYDDGKIEQICTYSYNENGQLVKMEFRSNSETLEVNDFQYDEQGRLTRVEWNFNSANQYPYAIVYTYNTDNTLATVEKLSFTVNDKDERFVKYRQAMEYTYENGLAVSAVYTDQDYGDWINFSYGVFDTWLNHETVDNYTFTYDQAGRLTTEICHHGSTMTYNTDGEMTNEQGSNIATTTYTTVYGDYIAYTPAN